MNANQLYMISKHNMKYHISRNEQQAKASLVDHGANGGMVGSDAIILEKTNRTADVTGIDDHQVCDLPIVTAAGLVQSQHGPVIAIMHQYAYHEQGKTIHSSSQLEWYKNEVNDKSSKVKGGEQRIITPDGYVLPLSIRNGLPYLQMKPPTQHDLDTLPHVILTSDEDWDPTVLDHEVDVESSPLMDLPDGFDFKEPRFDEHGIHCQSLFTFQPSPLTSELEPDPMSLEDEITMMANLAIHEREVKVKPPDFEKLRPMFGWQPTEVIKRTFQATT